MACSVAYQNRIETPDLGEHLMSQPSHTLYHLDEHMDINLSVAAQGPKFHSEIHQQISSL